MDYIEKSSYWYFTYYISKDNAAIRYDDAVVASSNERFPLRSVLQCFKESFTCCGESLMKIIIVHTIEIDKETFEMYSLDNNVEVNE